MVERDAHGLTAADWGVSRTKPHVIEYVARDPKRHSVRWDAEDREGVLTTVYIRTGLDPVLDAARKIRVTVEVLE